MPGGSLAAACELAVVFVLRPLLAFAFVFSFIVLSWYVAWRTVLVHVPLVQEIAGLRRKKPVKPKPLNRGRISKFYQSQAQSDLRTDSNVRTTYHCFANGAEFVATRCCGNQYDIKC